MYSRPSDQHPILLQYGPGGNHNKDKGKEHTVQYMYCA